MVQRPDDEEPRTQGDGVRTRSHASGSLLRTAPPLVIVVTLSIAAFLMIRPLDRSKSVDPQPTDPAGATAPHAALPAPAQVEQVQPVEPVEPREAAPPRAASVHGAIRRRAESNDSTVPEDETRKNAPGEERTEIDAGEYINLLRAAGETEGMAAFSPPGTRPPRTGVIVPDDYVLPEGFARHYQTTDDGRRLAPILAVAPEYELVDRAGKPVSLADGHIVPPEFAPSDLPIRMLEVPSGNDRERGDR